MVLGVNRLKKKNKISSVYRGYYVVVPPEYSSRGILPPPMYIDTLMTSLHKKYYVGLLNAAAMFGASHQQPQEFFVCTMPPAHRLNTKKGMRINFFTKKSITNSFVVEKKTQMGYFKVSSPELTAADLIQFEKRIGGLNRAATVLDELVEEIKPDRLTKEFVQYIPVSTLQRLGFVLEHILHQNAHASALYAQAMNAELQFFRIALKQGAPIRGFSSHNRWKIIQNITIEHDE
jgi:predicted transcriptional regulator of viral defense system